MDKKTKGIIATVATVLLCGCPGTCVILFGAISAAGYGTTEFNGSAGQISTSAGIIMLCIGIILLLIPIIVAFLSFRTKKNEITEVLNADNAEEKLPPAI